MVVVARTFASLLLLALVISGSHALNQQHDEDAFIGWQGESYKPVDPTKPGQDAGSKVAGGTAGDSSTAAAEKKKWIEIVSWQPRAFIYHNFLSDEEANHIKKLAAPMMKRSTVVGPNGSSVLDDYRTSYGTFIKRKSDAVITDIEARVSHWARIPAVNAEDMQVLRYGLGQQYKPHMDTLRDEVAGARVCTVLLYLNDVPGGGETAFPDSNHWVDASLPGRLGPFSACAQGRIAFRPKKGDAFMFWSIKPDGRTEDPFSMHTGCPVLKGVKWTATLWIHGRPFRPETYGDKEPYDIDPGICKDASTACQGWAKAGECEANAGFMLGEVGHPGHCMKACGRCTPCAAGDTGCYNANRRAAGFLVYSEDDLDVDRPGTYDAA